MEDGLRGASGPSALGRAGLGFRAPTGTVLTLCEFPFDATKLRFTLLYTTHRENGFFYCVLFG